MKNKTILYPKLNASIVYCLVFTFLLFSCNKPSLVNDPKGQNAPQALKEGDDVYVKNGRLVIRDRSTYYNILSSLHEMNDSLLDEWEANLGFTSIRKYFEDNSETDSTECPIEDAFFATLLNKDGIIQIGMRIYKIDVPDEKVFIIPDSDEKKIPYFSYNQAIKDTILSVGMASDSAWYITFTSYLDENYDGYFDESDDEHKLEGPCLESAASPYADVGTIPYTNGGHHYRVKFRNEYKTYGIYSFFLTKLKHERRNFFFVWIGYETELSMRSAARWKPRCHPKECGQDYGVPLPAVEMQWQIWWSVTKKLHAYFLIQTDGYKRIGDQYLTYFNPNTIYCNYCSSGCDEPECLDCL